MTTALREQVGRRAARAAAARPCCLLLVNLAVTLALGAIGLVLGGFSLSASDEVRDAREHPRPLRA